MKRAILQQTVPDVRTPNAVYMFHIESLKELSTMQLNRNSQKGKIVRKALKKVEDINKQQSTLKKIFLNTAEVIIEKQRLDVNRIHNIPWIKLEIK